MKKIPTLFVRDFESPSNGRYVTEEVTPGCEWVLAGEGTATRKFDGTCVMFDGEHWWARREVKKDKSPPENWVEIDHDSTTGKSVGWEPIKQSSFYPYFIEAKNNAGELVPSTYELIGPKINGNPEKAGGHMLVLHGEFPTFWLEGSQTFKTLRVALTSPSFKHEGIVWHHPDGRMCKLKKRDFPKQESA